MVKLTLQAVFIWLALLSAASSAQSTPLAQPASPSKEGPPGALSLIPVETIVTEETANGFAGPFPCDSDGNLYLRSASGLGVIRKLNAKGERVALYEPAANPDVEVQVVGYFSVTPDGEVYVLAFAKKELPRYVLVFRSDGAYKAKIKLELRYGWSPYSLAVFSSGTMLITGLRYDRGPDQPKVPFTGIFAADGRLLKELSLEDDTTIRSMISATDPISGHAIASGELKPANDGNLYLMRSLNPAVVYAISPAGEIVRRFTVDPGDGGYLARTMHIAGNRIALFFFNPQSMEKVVKIVDLEGQELASYNEGLRFKVVGCYMQEPERFTLLSTDAEHKIKMQRAEAR